MRPSVRDAVQTIATLSRRVSSAQPALVEKRYPYLDQDLVEFLSAIPLDQLQRSGQRRFLMRRALADLLPAEVLTRTTKSRIGRCYCRLVQTHWATLSDLFADPLSARMGYIERERLRKALLELKSGKVPTYSLALLKVVALETWLSATFVRGVISTSLPHKQTSGSAPDRYEREQVLLSNPGRR